jgi:hypothetical protein
MIKRHVLLVISDKPVDTRSLSRRKDVRHLIKEELTLTSCPIGVWQILKKVKYFGGNEKREVLGIGKSESVAIATWLKSLVSSHHYIPRYKKRERGQK